MFEEIESSHFFLSESDFDFRLKKVDKFSTDEENYKLFTQMQRVESKYHYAKKVSDKKDRYYEMSRILEILLSNNYFNSEIRYNLAIIFSKLERLKQYQTFNLKRSDKLNKFLDFKSLLEIHFNKSRNADFYAEKLNITYKHLNTICKSIIALTAKQFIDEYIILEAKRLLVNSEIKSTELAYFLGFEEPTNFVKYFKKHTKFTPNQFKKDYV